MHYGTTIKATTNLKIGYICKFSLEKDMKTTKTIRTTNYYGSIKATKILYGNNLMVYVNSDYKNNMDTTINHKKFY